MFSLPLLRFAILLLLLLLIFLLFLLSLLYHYVVTLFFSIQFVYIFSYIIDRLPDRLAMAERYMDVETIDFCGTDMQAELWERTGGRGPDVCIEAVGMEAHTPGVQFGYDQLKQQLRLQTDRPAAVRDAILEYPTQ